jgi:hypothetical protein
MVDLRIQNSTLVSFKKITFSKEPPKYSFVTYVNQKTLYLSVVKDIYNSIL